MAVLLETSRGDMVIDLYTDECPMASKNFIKLCKMKYYNDVLFYNVQNGFIVQTGDPTNTGKGGSSVYGIMYGEQARLFEDEIHPHIKHRKRGMVGMAGGGKDANASQFYITTGTDLDSLDEKHTLFGEVSEGFDTLEAIDDAFVDDNGRPLQNIRIRHTIVLDDPFDDPPQLAEHIPESSPEPVFVEGDTRLEDDWVPDQDTRPLEEVEEENRKNEARNRAVVLEMIGDLPEADSKPPTNMLFVCKLNPVTTEEDLEIIFSRFGTITSCDIIRDYKTGDSLCYAFIGFDTDKASEEAYFKMNNVLIDDRRIKVDFSQSVSHLWRQFKRFGNKADAATGAEANGAGGLGPGRGGGGPGGGACFKCGQPGHIARECPGTAAATPSAAAPAANGGPQLKAGFQRAAQHGGGGQSYELMLDDGPAANELPSSSGRNHRADRDRPSGSGSHRPSRRHDSPPADWHRDRSNGVRDERHRQTAERDRASERDTERRHEWHRSRERERGGRDGRRAEVDSQRRRERGQSGEAAARHERRRSSRDRSPDRQRHSRDVSPERHRSKGIDREGSAGSGGKKRHKEDREDGHPKHKKHKKHKHRHASP